MSEINDNSENNNTSDIHGEGENHQKRPFPCRRELTLVAVLLVGWLLFRLANSQVIPHLAHALRHALHFNFTAITHINMMFYHFYHLFITLMVNILIAFIPGLFLTMPISLPRLLRKQHQIIQSIRKNIKKILPSVKVKYLLSTQLATPRFKAQGIAALTGILSSMLLLSGKTYFGTLIYHPVAVVVINATGLMLENILLFIILIIPLNGYSTCYQFACQSRQRIYHAFHSNDKSRY